MTNKDKKFLIPVSGQWVEVSKEIYYEYYRPIWRTRNNAKYRNQCRCTRSEIWKCDGVCQGCPYYTAGDTVSLDCSLEEDDGNLTVENTLESDDSSIESIIIDMELLEALYNELESLDPICELMMQYSEREAAEMMGLSRSTFKREWAKIQRYLRARLKKFYE